MKKPHLLLITTDQQRYDALGANGNRLIKTPHMDGLAGEGVNFQKAFVQNPVCVPSRACLQTGRYPHQHGVTYMENVVDNTPGLPVWEKTFMEMLQEGGYRTGAAGKIHMYPEKGFDHERLTGGKGVRWTASEGSPLGHAPLGKTYARWLEKKRPGGYEEIYKARLAQADYARIGLLENPLKADEYVEHWIAEEAIQFVETHLAGKSDAPFFLWCGFCGPHDPWDPPEPWKSLYDPASVPLPREIPGWPSWRERAEEPLVRRVIASYWAMVSCIDHYVGKILSLLKERGIYDETLIVFTSDHGELLGERGRFGKGCFTESVIRVPLLVKPPRALPLGFHRTDALAEVFSIAPTFLDYAGLSIPDRMTAQSLRPLMKTGKGGVEAVFSEYVSNDRKRHGKCVRTARHKLVRWLPDGEEELYDLATDPGEAQNLARVPAYQATRGELFARLYDRLAGTEWRHIYK